MSHEARKRCRWCMAAFTARSRAAVAEAAVFALPGEAR